MRDPRIDPQKNDIVSSVDAGFRQVISRHGNDIEYTTGKNRLKLCWITTWQDWCRKNNVTATTADG